ncbi:MAG: MFS transporter [Arenicella sp.]
MSSEQKKFTPLERRAVFGLSAIYGLRMFGLFLILPVLSIYAVKLEGSTPFLVGLTLGAYGIAQAILQIPFGLLSDKYGRKKLITIGLVIFILGSLIAGLADNIYWMIFGRALQGSGAIAAAVLALTADLTRENQRSKSMAIIGLTIGSSFMLAFIAASPLVALFGFSGLFYVTAVLAVFAIFALWFYVPNQAPRSSRDVKFVASDFANLLKHQHLMRLNYGIFVLHCVLTAMFVVVPLLLSERVALSSSEHWKVYVPVMLASVVFMAPLVMASADKARLIRVFLFAIILLMIAQVILFISKLDNVYSVALCLFIFFVGFNALEAMLPSLVTRVAPAAMKGTAVGIYNTFQFSGVFIGGAVGGLLMGNGGVNGVFVFCGLLLASWALIVILSPRVELYDSRLVRLTDPSLLADAVVASRSKTLLSLAGVKDVTVIEQENIAYLKIDKSTFVVQALGDLEIVDNR